MLKRKKTRTISIGRVRIGGSNPVAVQAALKTDPQNLQETVSQLRDLKRVGCEVATIALTHEETCKAIPFLRKEVDLPIVGDVRSNPRIVFGAMECGVDGIRIDPGVIGNLRKVKEVASAARDARIPVRIGINIGSLERRVQKKYQTPDAHAVVESALYHTKLFEDAGHGAISVSLRASSVLQTIEAYLKFSEASDQPLHLSIAEAGPPFSGAIKSSLGLGILLYNGIGDVIRVCLTGSPVHEVTAAYHILRNLDLRKRGINIISCPTCARCRVDLKEIVGEIERETDHIDAYLEVAIMGCQTNGPTEASHADVGIAFGAQKVVLFSKGAIKKTGIPKELAKALLMEEIDHLSR
jgi:(E)-4-hydroxy-3-methylbut-2-enyl-diphosphate synthase